MLLPDLPGFGGLDVVNGLGGRPPLDPKTFNRPAPAPGEGERDAARAAAAAYLAAWAAGDEQALLALTSPLAADYAKDLKRFRHLRAGRPDEGVFPGPRAACDPATRGAPWALRPVEGLTQWELGWLAGYAAEIGQLCGRNQANPAAGASTQAQVKQGDLLACRYTVAGRDFLMLVARHRGKWQVLEPALPL